MLLMPAAQILPLPSQENFSTEQNLLVEYQEDPQDPYFHGPCPISPKIQKEIYHRCLPIGFENEPNKRQWQSIIESLEEKNTIGSFKQNLREFVLVLIKLEHPHAYQLLGLSERGDLLAYTRVAICDEIAILHHHVKDGIDSVIDEISNKNPTLIPLKHDRSLFEVFYRSCRMTTINSFRFDSSLFTRSAFYPSSQDWNLILKALEVDPKRPNEGVCTYKKLLIN
jgi:hypothetical protein